MNTLHYILLGLLSLGVLCSCTDHRDLFVSPYPLLLIGSDWRPAQISTANGATVLIFDRPGLLIELMPDAERKTVRLDRGLYDVLLFNGLMYSPDETHLDNIRYRNINRFETFEAYVTPLPPAAIFRSRADEVVAGFPDILATRSTVEHEIKDRRRFELKYRDGQNGFPTSADFLADSLLFSPCRVTHTCQVIARVRHPESARIVQASLRGFAGSVFLANRLPGHTPVTHQFRLNSLQPDRSDPEVGIISSPIFHTFGPPLDLPSQRYELEVNVLLTNSQEYPSMTFDVTDQVVHIIEYLKTERLKHTPIMKTFYLLIEYELPPIASDGLNVGLADWGNDVIVTVPIHLEQNGESLR